MTEFETETEELTREMERFAVNFCDKNPKGNYPSKTAIARAFFVSVGCVSYRLKKYGIIDHYKEK